MKSLRAAFCLEQRSGTPAPKLSVFPEPSDAGLPSQGALAGLDGLHFLVPVYGIYKNLLCLSRFLILSHDRVTYLDL